MVTADPPRPVTATCRPSNRLISCPIAQVWRCHCPRIAASLTRVRAAWVYRREAVGAEGAVAQLALVVVTPALDRAGVLLTTTLSEPAPHQIACATCLRLASLHVDERVLVIAQGRTQASEPARQHTSTAKLELGPYTAQTPQGPAVQAHFLTQPTPSLPLLLTPNHLPVRRTCGRHPTIKQSSIAEARRSRPGWCSRCSTSRLGIASCFSRDLARQQGGRGGGGNVGLR